MRDLLVLDSFAGAGGFSLGFEQAGCKIIGAIEIDKWASETFKFNHPDATVITEDIRGISNEDLAGRFATRKPDIILGGPPCQGFSIANSRGGDPKDPRNSLFREFIRLGSIFQPQLMVMENVPNLMKAKTEQKEMVIDIIEKELVELGYHVYIDILSAIDYGVPQIRKRLIVVATKSPLQRPFPPRTHSFDEPDLFDSNLQRCPTLWDAISDLPQILARQGSEEMDYLVPPQNDFQSLMRKGSTVLSNHKAMNHSKRLVERFASMKWGDSTSDVASHLMPIKRNSGGEFSSAAYDQNNRRMHPDKPCHTIAASFYANFVHPYLDRNFTAREGARIQTFPDTFVFKGKPTVVSHKLLTREDRLEERFLCQYNQIGNAVPPRLSNAIAKNIIDQLRSFHVRSWGQSGAERNTQDEVQRSVG